MPNVAIFVLRRVPRMSLDGTLTDVVSSQSYLEDRHRWEVAPGVRNVFAVRAICNQHWKSRLACRLRPVDVRAYSSRLASERY